MNEIEGAFVPSLLVESYLNATMSDWTAQVSTIPITHMGRASDRPPVLGEGRVGKGLEWLGVGIVEFDLDNCMCGIAFHFT